MSRIPFSHFIYVQDSRCMVENCVSCSSCLDVVQVQKLSILLLQRTRWLHCFSSVTSLGMFGVLVLLLCMRMN
uniref:Uncharacterized protein n=1 Tax=Aegilops tauschii subsp. strangulata TaxID=200361 RepID=A0A453L592_AEGTS